MHLVSFEDSLVFLCRAPCSQIVLGEHGSWFTSCILHFGDRTCPGVINVCDGPKRYGCSLCICSPAIVPDLKAARRSLGLRAVSGESLNLGT